jgi:hypothetical protein
MATGSNSGTARIFLTVGFGKIRQKSLENKQRVDANTPNAVMRELANGGQSWALEHDYVSGVIENIFYKEDKQYGNSFEVVMRDGVELYQISFSEESRFCADFLKKLPNVNLSNELKITAYDFTNQEGKHVAGVSLEQDGTKITSFYDKKHEKDGKVTWELLHGFPKSEGVDFKDKDETKIYFIQVKKFLRSEFSRLFSDKFNKPEPKQEVHEDLEENSADIPSQPSDDIPF